MKKVYVIMVTFQKYDVKNVSQEGYKTCKEALDVIFGKIREEDLMRITDMCYKDTHKDIFYTVREVTIV